MKFQRRVRRVRDGHFEVHLSTEERDVLRALPGQVREALIDADPDDPAIARLNPSAFPDDPDLDAEYRELMSDDLNAGRLEALQALEDSVDADQLLEEQVVAWLRAVNDMRLLLGTRLDVSEDPNDRRVPAEDPRAPGFALYDYLSVLEEDLVEALAG